MDVGDVLQQWWQQQTLAEVVAVITGLACVYLAAKNSIYNWPFAIVSVCLYIYIFYNAHLFADMGLQVYFLVMNIYGWYYWLHKPDGSGLTPVIGVTRMQIISSVIAVMACTYVLGSVLKYTSASYPYLDSFCAACSVIAQLLMARRILQNWLLWIFVDIIYVGIYIFKGLHLTAIMYAVYIAIAIMGYVEWRRDMGKKHR